MSAFIAFLAVAQSSSSKLGTRPTAQNRDTVRRLYGSPVSEVFRTPQNLTVTASFASNGSLCRAVIKSDVESGITDLQLHTVLEELAPPAVLGKFKIATFLDIICMKLRKAESATSDSTGKTATELAVDACGECSGASEEYERAYVTRYGNTNQYSSVHITFRQPECEGLNTVHP